MFDMSLNRERYKIKSKGFDSKLSGHPEASESTSWEVDTAICIGLTRLQKVNVTVGIEQAAGQVFQPFQINC